MNSTFISMYNKRSEKNVERKLNGRFTSSDIHYHNNIIYLIYPPTYLYIQKIGIYLCIKIGLRAMLYS